ncbi:hypothetical protein M0R45_030715 [Rubus argutus]
MKEFCEFIRETNLCDPPLQNAEYTWSNLRENVVWCRLDQFLYSVEWENIFPNVRQSALNRITSDHCPILLDTIGFKWGPCPFRFENMWLEHPSFKENFRIWWGEINSQGWMGFKFMRKLKGLKDRIKVWSKEIFGYIGKEKKEIETNIKSLVDEDMIGGLSVEKLRERELLKGKLEELTFREEISWKQRAKSQWEKEGDNNTRFFHKIVNGRKKKFHRKIRMSKWCRGSRRWINSARNYRLF